MNNIINNAGTSLLPKAGLGVLSLIGISCYYLTDKINSMFVEEINLVNEKINFNDLEKEIVKLNNDKSILNDLNSKLIKEII
jgi:hypothetical protein